LHRENSGRKWRHFSEGYARTRSREGWGYCAGRGRLWEPGAILALNLANLIMTESIADLFAKQLEDLKDQDVISQRKTKRTLDRLHAMIEELKLLDCEQD